MLATLQLILFLYCVFRSVLMISYRKAFIFFSLGPEIKLLINDF